MDDVAEPGFEPEPLEGASTAVAPGFAGTESEPPHRRRRWPLVVGAAVIVAGGITALSLGGSSSSASAAQDVASAASSSLADGSFQFTLTGTTSVAGENLKISGTGTTNAAQKAMSMTATYAVGGTTKQLEEILIGSTIYIGGPAFSSLLPNGATWLSADISALSKLEDASGGATSASPSSFMDTLSHPGSGVTVTDLGTGSINGVAVHRYHVVISPSALKARIESSGLSSSTKAQILSSLSGSAESMDVAIDSQQHLVQMAMSTSVSLAGQQVDTSITMNLSGWGGVYPISAPPASEVYDASHLFAGGTNGGAGISSL